jgi:acetate kinase
MDSPQLIAFLHEKVELFKEFPPDRLDELVKGSRQTTFEGNEAVIEFGEEGWFLGVLLSGQAEASVTDNTGQKVRLSLLEPGSIFGEISLMTGNKTIASIVGITRCSALLIPQHLFSTMLVTQPSAIRYLSRSMTQRTTQWATLHTLAAEALQKSDDPYGLKLKTEHPEKLLIINCGSSSLKYALFDTANEAHVVRGAIERIGLPGTRHSCRAGDREITRAIPEKCGYDESFRSMVDMLTSREVGALRSLHEIKIGRAHV